MRKKWFEMTDVQEKSTAASRAATEAASEAATFALINKKAKRENWVRRGPLLPALVFMIVVTQIPFIIAAITGLIVLPYLFVLVPLVLRRFKAWPGREAPFSHRAWGIPLTLLPPPWDSFVFSPADWPRWKVCGIPPRNPAMVRGCRLPRTCLTALCGNRLRT